MADLRFSVDMIFRAVVLSGSLVLTACAPDGLADQIAREQARDAVRPVLAKQFPGVPLEPATDCVINSASANEIIRLASAGVTGVEVEDAELVIKIATRKDTVKCLIEDGLAPLLI